jgi:serine protease AprX
MLNTSIKQIMKPLLIVGIVGLIAWFTNQTYSKNTNQIQQSYIISANDFQLLQNKLNELAVQPTHKLAIINAVAVSLNPEQLSSIQVLPEVKVSPNFKVELSSGKSWGKRKWQPRSVVNDQIDASDLHSYGIYGEGITIGFLDTGLDQLSGLSTDLYGRDKAWGTYDAINNTVSNYDDEASGHGTHVASIATNSDYDVYGKVYGVAPNASVVGIKAFDAEGKGTYADVIRGIDWALQVKDQINLKVLNMSFSGPVRSHYWDDPLNKAVMKAWQAGIVVVASAGNKGPGPMTVGVPGNVPYIITVGAMTDNYTANDSSDDKVATFSAAGPTAEGFVKPDIVAPGGHLSGLMSFDSEIVTSHPEYHDGGRYFEMSGTSQAAGVVSGVVALMLQYEPSLTPDEVKCRLMDGAHTALNNEAKLAYSVFQQGSGVVNAFDALVSSASNCANQTLDIAKDLAGEQHYSGPSNITPEGDFYVEGLGDEYVWKHNQDTVEGTALLWRVNYSPEMMMWKNTASTDALLWRVDFETDALLWRVNFETDALLWRVNFEPNNVASIEINNWVEQQ